MLDLCTVFKLPLELFFEILSYFVDHQRFIRENYRGRQLYMGIERKHAERLIVIRKLTMTCWPLRSLLLPLLWTDVEGCISHFSYNYEAERGSRLKPVRPMYLFGLDPGNRRLRPVRPFPPPPVECASENLAGDYSGLKSRYIASYGLCDVITCIIC